MLKLQVKEVEIEDDNRCFIECEDEHGNAYRFPLTYKKASMIALLLIDAYVPQESIYEFIIKLLDETGFYIDYVAINDGYENKAVVKLKDYSTNDSKIFYMPIPDALILHLMSNSKLYVKKEAEILLADEVDKFFWYRFLKELDLC